MSTTLQKLSPTVFIGGPVCGSYLEVPHGTRIFEVPEYITPMVPLKDIVWPWKEKMRGHRYVLKGKVAIYESRREFETISRPLW